MKNNVEAILKQYDKYYKELKERLWPEIESSGDNEVAIFLALVELACVIMETGGKDNGKATVGMKAAEDLVIAATCAMPDDGALNKKITELSKGFYKSSGSTRGGSNSGNGSLN